MPMPRCRADTETRRGESSNPRTSAQRWTVPRSGWMCCSGAKTKITLATQPSRSRSTAASRMPRATAKPSSTAKALGCKRLQAATTCCRFWQGTLQKSSGKVLVPSKVGTVPRQKLASSGHHLDSSSVIDSVRHKKCRFTISFSACSQQWPTKNGYFHVFSVLVCHRVPSPLAALPAPP